MSETFGSYRASIRDLPASDTTEYFCTGHVHVVSDSAPRRDWSAPTTPTSRHTEGADYATGGLSRRVRGQRKRSRVTLSLEVHPRSSLSRLFRVGGGNEEKRPLGVWTRRTTGYRLVSPECTRDGKVVTNVTLPFRSWTIRSSLLGLFIDSNFKEQEDLYIYIPRLDRVSSTNCLVFLRYN